MRIEEEIKLDYKDVLIRPKRSTLKSRNENIDLLYQMLSNELTKKETDYWLEALKKSDIPAAKVNFPAEIFKDKNLQETNFFRETNHPDIPNSKVGFD